MKRTIALCLGLLALASPAAADSPVAVVEDVKGKVTGAEFMDYVTPKAVIKIGDGGSVILSYLKSCRRETISGAGTVIVGTEESAVHLAEVKAEKTELRSQPGQRDHARNQRRRRHRAAQRRRAASLPQPQLTLYGASPLVEAKGRGKLIIRRLDVAGRASGDQSGRHPAQGTLPRFRRRERRPGSRRPLRRHVQIIADRVPGGCAGQARRDADRRPVAADGIGVTGHPA